MATKRRSRVCVELLSNEIQTTISTVVHSIYFKFELSCVQINCVLKWNEAYFICFECVATNVMASPHMLLTPPSAHTLPLNLIIASFLSPFPATFAWYMLVVRLFIYSITSVVLVNILLTFCKWIHANLQHKPPNMLARYCKML